MSIKIKGAALLFVATTVLGLGTSAFATNLTSVETSKDNIIVLGKDAEKEADGIAKISFDMGETWIAQSDYFPSDEKSEDYWTYDEYKSYAETVEKDLIQMLADREPYLSETDILTWQEDTEQTLELIKAGGMISKNSIETDDTLVISGFDNSFVEITGEKK